MCRFLVYSHKISIKCIQCACGSCLTSLHLLPFLLAGTIPHIDKHILPLISLEDQFFGGVDHEEEEVMELRNRLAGVLERAVIGMEVFAEVYEEYIPLMHTDAQEYVEQGGPTQCCLPHCVLVRAWAFVRASYPAFVDTLGFVG